MTATPTQDGAHGEPEVETDPAFSGDVPEVSPHARPVCPRCFRPFERTDDYCDGCGQAVGTYTEYLPFVNIRWQVAGYDRLWRRIWPGEVGRVGQVVGVIIALALAPFLLLALPFVKRRDGQAEVSRPAPPPETGSESGRATDRESGREPASATGSESDREPEPPGP